MALVEMYEAGRMNLGIIYEENEKRSNSSKAKREKFIVEVSSWGSRAKERGKVHDI